LKKKWIIVGIVIAVIAIPLGIYTISPLFVNTVVNEEIPGSNSQAISEFERFMRMSEEQRFERAQQMNEEEKNMIMTGAAQTGGNSVNESMAEEAAAEGSLTGNFVGVNDGIHNAEGLAKVIVLDEGNRILRLENFRATNGPDLYVYLSTDRSASDFVSLGRLKGNIGNQNYEIPEGTDLSKYGTALIWCRAFSVLFGSAELKAQ
jgi:Electron transfer DM13